MSASIIASATRLYPELSEHESVFARRYTFLTTYFTPISPRFPSIREGRS
jgi:hypothetical protein